MVKCLKNRIFSKKKKTRGRLYPSSDKESFQCLNVLHADKSNFFPNFDFMLTLTYQWRISFGHYCFNSACPKPQKCAVRHTFLKRVCPLHHLLSCSVNHLQVPRHPHLIHTHIYIFIGQSAIDFTPLCVFMCILYMHFTCGNQALFIWDLCTITQFDFIFSDIHVYHLHHGYKHTHKPGYDEDNSSTHTYASIKHFLLSSAFFRLFHVDVIKSTASL